jgi:O-methyltransferase involved in polyketide biosynthesis
MQYHQTAQYQRGNHRMEPINPKQDQVAATPDGFGIGMSQGQRSAEIVAAVREERMPSPETKALSRWSARLFNKLAFSLLKHNTKDALLNYFFIRNEGMRLLCNEAIEGKENPVMVDIASGFSPRALLLAREVPNLRVIEIDQAPVIDEKKRRFRVGHIDIPENLEFTSADLARVPLSQVLNGLLVDVISAEGLNPYFPPAEVIQIAKGIYKSLKSDGVYVSSIALREGVNEITEALRFASRQVGNILSIMENEEDAKELFIDAGYQEVSLHLATNLADTYDLPKPVFNLEAFIVAKKL